MPAGVVSVNKGHVLGQPVVVGDNVLEVCRGLLAVVRNVPYPRDLVPFGVFHRRLLDTMGPTRLLLLIDHNPITQVLHPAHVFIVAGYNDMEPAVARPVAKANTLLVLGAVTPGEWGHTSTGEKIIGLKIPQRASAKSDYVCSTELRIVKLHTIIDSVI